MWNGGHTSPATCRASLFNYTQPLWIMWSRFFLRESLVCPYPNRNPLMFMGCNGSKAAKANRRSANKNRLIRPTTVPRLQTLPSKTLSLGCAFPSVMQPGREAGLLTQGLGSRGRHHVPLLLWGWWQPYMNLVIIKCDSCWDKGNRPYISEFCLIVSLITSHCITRFSALASHWRGSGWANPQHSLSGR